jgi:2-polyprenyl-3-methyl-5-hydroxy-6-metoxy-1,4-benzoquinol methylase
MTDPKLHWENVYHENAPEEVSWFKTAHESSLSLIERTGMKKDDWIIDIGAGASTLVDQLVARGYKKIALLDVSSNALEYTKTRLGAQAQGIEWVVSDITKFRPNHPFTLWHDRAVFHFLTEPQDRQNYVRALKDSLLPGGHIVMATFAIGGPTQCSGLDIVQYDPATLSQELGDSFELLESLVETHHTPWNSEQKFIYCLFRLK